MSEKKDIFKCVIAELDKIEREHPDDEEIKQASKRIKDMLR